MTIPSTGRYRLRGGRQRVLLKGSLVVGAFVAAGMFIRGLTVLSDNGRPDGVLSVLGVAFVSLFVGGFFAGSGQLAWRSFYVELDFDRQQVHVRQWVPFATVPLAFVQERGIEWGALGTMLLPQNDGRRRTACASITRPGPIPVLNHSETESPLALPPPFDVLEGHVLVEVLGPDRPS